MFAIFLKWKIQRLVASISGKTNTHNPSPSDTQRVANAIERFGSASARPLVLLLRSTYMQIDATNAAISGILPKIYKFKEFNERYGLQSWHMRYASKVVLLRHFVRHGAKHILHNLHRKKDRRLDRKEVRLQIHKSLYINALNTLLVID